MRCTVATILSAAIFSLCAFARPSPSEPAASSTLLAKRFASGWCSVHVTQYQKNEGPTGSDGGTSEYRLTVTLEDALQDVVGGVTELSVPGGSYADIDSQLPAVFEVQVGATDAQPVQFKYNGQAWETVEKQCSVGAYQNGSRDLDCGFFC